MLSIVKKYNASSGKIELKNLLERANYLAKHNNIEALEDLQRLVLRPLQSQHMLDAYLKDDHDTLQKFHHCIDIGIGFITGLQKHFIEFIFENSIERELLIPAKLGRDNVLPTSWHPSSMLNSIGQIGEGRKCGNWIRDSNHNLLFMYPLNIYFVCGGNHSIAVGILQAEGFVAPQVGYDLSGLYAHIFFDGDQWVDSKTGGRIGKPRYKELGFVYEIGRLIATLKN
ncbi:MAG TPA: hypothetical protein PK129_03810 [Cellvibrionaceae bacterium]|nr:hypothetical protein [Cellvibrionaceae bacterium]